MTGLFSFLIGKYISLTLRLTRGGLDDEAIKAAHPYVSVSLAVKNADGKYFGEVGDEVEVYYDGTVSDGEIGKVDHVYCILIMTPADRSTEDVS